MKKRGKLTLLALLVLIVAAALASRSDRAAFLPGFLRAYAGDTLWAAALYVLLAVLRPSTPPFEIFLGALILSLAVEFSQLYHAPWIDGLRHTFPLGYILGYGFLWSDVICYSAGVSAAYLIDRMQTERKRF